MRGLEGSALIIALALGVMEAQACDVSLRTNDVIEAPAVDPFSPRVVSMLVPVVLVNNSRDVCLTSLNVESETGDANVLRSATSALGYELRDQRGDVIVVGGRGIPVRATPGRTTINFRAVVKGGDSADAGHYEDVLLVSAASPDGEVLDGPRPLRLGARITPRAQVNIAGQRGPFLQGSGLKRINFGSLTTGETQRVFVQVRSNTDISVAVDSQNGGVMKHTSMPTAPGIEYTLRFDGDLIGQGARRIALRRPRPGLRGESYPLDITVGDVTGKYAGDYRDLVRISVMHY